MEKLKFTTNIRAPRKKVWDVMLNDDTYRIWASVFMPGSYAETDWKEGSKALFLGQDGSGMVSRIEKNIPNEYLSIQHLGFIKDGVEDLTSEKVKQWSGAHENYTLKENNGVTEVLVELDSDDEFKDYFGSTWPKALEKVKELSEKN